MGLNRLTKLMPANRKPVSAAMVAKHLVRIVTATARACFWLLCYYHFGTEALLFLAAAWTFLLSTKDLTFARVRLRNMADAAKRRTAMVKSLGFELVLLGLRLGLIALLGRLLLPYNFTVAALVSGLMVCAVFWARETLVTLGRVFGVSPWMRYSTLLSSLSGLGLIAWFAERGFEPVQAATTALILREAITFTGFAVVVLLGWSGRRPVDGGRTLNEQDEDGEEDGAGRALTLIGANGREVRSTFKIFIADNVVHSRWRIVQFGTRALANGLLGPLGSVGSRIFFTYRKPGAFVDHKPRPPLGRIVAMSVALLLVAAVLAYLAYHFDLLHALGILVAAFVLRIAGLGLNLMLWRHFRPLIMTSSRIRPMDLLFPRSRQPKADKPAP